jgi:hypothetical protein
MENGIIATRWVCNSFFTIISATTGWIPCLQNPGTHEMERRLLSSFLPLQLEQRNKYVGEREIMDENVARYRINITGNKWRWPTFVRSAWILSRKTGTSLFQMQLRHSASRHYPTANPIRSTESGSSGNSAGNSRFIEDVTDWLQWCHRQALTLISYVINYRVILNYRRGFHGL